MAFSLKDGDDDLAETHEINVTPFIDVILVLLIIFMVAAPLSTVDWPVDLPTSSAQPQARPDDPIYLTIAADHQMHVGDLPADQASLAAALRTATKGDEAARIFVRADKTVSYGDLMQVLDAVRQVGYRHVSLVTLETD